MTQTINLLQRQTLPPLAVGFQRLLRLSWPIEGTALQIAIVWCALLSPVSIKAELAPCESRSTTVAQLCAAISPVGWNFSPPKDLQKSLDIVATAITQSSDSVRVLSQPIDLAISQSLSGKAADYCSALANRVVGQFQGNVLATACLRPTCLLQVPQELARYPSECASIPAEGRRDFERQHLRPGRKRSRASPASRGKPVVCASTEKLLPWSLSLTSCDPLFER